MGSGLSGGACPQAGQKPDPGAEHPVLVPFGGAEHDWSAVEVAAWIASATGAALKLIGTEGDRRAEKRNRPRFRKAMKNPRLAPCGSQNLA